MNVDKNTFCAAPWFQIRNTTLGSYCSCCEVDHDKSTFSGNKDFAWPKHLPSHWNNSDYARYLRSKLTIGVRLPECHKCWSKEDAGQQSLRQTINDTVANNRSFESSWMQSYFRKKQDYEHDLLLAADVQVTNLCNFGCVMCEPGSSSHLYQGWRRDQDHPSIKKQLQIFPINYLDQVRETYINRNNYDLLQYVIDQSPRYLKIIGGEPLIDQQLMSVLCNQLPEVKSKIKLYITTNGSQDLCDAQQRLSGYQEVFWVVSLESTGKLQDYVRKGSIWSDIEHNIDRFLAEYGSQRLYIAYVIQSLTLSGLPTLLEWAQQRKIPVATSLLAEPEFMDVRSLPTEMKSRLVERLSKATKYSIPLGILDPASINIAGLCELIEGTKYDRSAMLDLREWLDWYDPEQQWREVVPEWLPYFET
jgi:organic radical activating enzyme